MTPPNKTHPNHTPTNAPLHSADHTTQASALPNLKRSATTFATARTGSPPQAEAQARAWRDAPHPKTQSSTGPSLM
ncbi:hypothetical protein [Phaeobacter gallaeciensis]|uniref:hypothetical protein n=1 Tax=Phaeobacter gallaeciensis TaxID=60890 RepID=UPI0015F0E7ED|nr:hypothetical protein [Phaeobacter gallaeciensis]